MTILLTGASGFVGQVVLKTALLRGLKVRPVYRSAAVATMQRGGVLISGHDELTDWSLALDDVDVVIHAAGRAYVMREESIASLAEYRRVNVEGTLNLARQAAAAGVRRFVFISSIKVNGETTVPGRPFTADDAPAPNDAYGLSKTEAEVQLEQVARETAMEVTIIRPPLIYGQGVKGNFASLISLVRRGIPLPFGSVKCNRRSLVGLDNLVDLILLCVDHPSAANQTFLVSDGEDLSTSELVTAIGKALGRSVMLISVPTGLLSFLIDLQGKKSLSERLLGSLQVDINKTCNLLDWKPPVPVVDGLRRAVE